MDAPPPYPPPTAERAHVAHVLTRTPVRTEPRGDASQRETLPTRARWNGGPVRLLVLDSTRDENGRTWLKVRLPARPNDRSGWINADRTRVQETVWRIEIDRSERRLRVRRKGKVVKSMSVVVGKRGTRTPVGLFAITERVRQPDRRGFLGSWALHITAHSETLRDYGGGKGRVAIHGRAGESLRDPLGSARSHGCVRVDDAKIRWLASKVRAGTPVEITE